MRKIYTLLMAALLWSGLPRESFGADAGGTNRTGQATVSGIVALEMEAAALQQALTNHIAEAQQTAVRAENRQTNLTLVVVLVVAVLVLLRLLAPKITQYLERRAEAREAAPSAASRVAEEESFAKFADALAVGPRPVSTEPAPTPACATPVGDAARKVATPVVPKAAPEVGRGSAAKDIAPLRALLTETGRATDEAARQKGLEKLRPGIVALKRKVELPELLPAWQVVSAFEGLLQQLLSRPGTVTPSALHSLAGALDLAGELCRPGVKANLRGPLGTGASARFVRVTTTRSFMR